MKITKELSLGELAAIVSSELRKSNIDCVLTGGAVVSIYTDNKYQSSDLDYISSNDHKEIEKALLILGFKKQGRSFTHKNTDFYVEFPKGPLAIGGEVIEADGEVIIAVFSYPIIIKEELGEIIVSAPDWGIFVAVNKPTSGGLSTKFTAQVAFAYVKVMKKSFPLSRLRRFLVSVKTQLGGEWTAGRFPA